MKRKCENCGDRCDEETMVATPNCQWICVVCFGEDPDAYGFELELDSDNL